eukprot:gene2191-3115_t
MEFMAWFSHKYIMHGFLWSLHADHHKKDHDSWFERNDAFFLFYAVVSIGCFLLWQKGIFDLGIAVGLEMPTIAMQELLEEHIKCTINIL